MSRLRQLSIFVIPTILAGSALCASSILGEPIKFPRLEDLILNSDIVIEAQPVRLTLDREGAGYAELSINRVLRGLCDSKTVTVRWGPLTYEMRPADLDKRYVLFLTQNADRTYAAAFEDVSHWPLSRTIVDNRLVAVYEYPLTLIEIPDELLRRDVEVFTGLGDKERVLAIYLSDLYSFVDTLP